MQKIIRLTRWFGRQLVRLKAGLVRLNPTRRRSAKRC
jgi:hypothetical protein